MPSCKRIHPARPAPSFRGSGFEELWSVGVQADPRRVRALLGPGETAMAPGSGCCIRIRFSFWKQLAGRGIPKWCLRRAGLQKRSGRQSRFCKRGELIGSLGRRMPGIFGLFVADKPKRSPPACRGPIQTDLGCAQVREQTKPGGPISHKRSAFQLPTHGKRERERSWMLLCPRHQCKLLTAVF